MIVTTAEDFRRAIAARNYEKKQTAVPRAVFLVEPADFRLSRQAARDNQYMDLTVAVAPSSAVDQHRNLSTVIADCGIPVVRFPGRPENPDDLFPNNVFATTRDRFIVGAMLHPERQREAQRGDIRTFFTDLIGSELIDLSNQDLIAELTGVLIIDRARNIGFCGMTHRVDEAGCEAMHKAFDLDLTLRFELKPEEYHTNVVMSILASRALVICPDAFVDPEVPAAISELYPERTLAISTAEKEAFAGNCIALSDQDLFFSATGWRTLTREKRDIVRNWGFEVHSVEMDEIEKAGGSLRCCVAEIF